MRHWGRMGEGAMDRPRILSVARGDTPADVVVRGGEVFNVYTGGRDRADVAIVDGVVAAVGTVGDGAREFDASGLVAIPGLIDTHVHLESSMVSPYAYAREVVRRGVTTVVCDPHEIANVAGLKGVRAMLAATEGLPLSVFVNAPSCVPATHFATAGAALGAADLVDLLSHPRVLGLAEVMNVPGAVLADPEVMAKIDAFTGRVIDGHAPGVSGPWLNAYVGAGIATDHECITAEEAREKLALGMRILIREGTGAKNLRALLEAVTPANARRFALCTDDRHPHDLLDEGSVDHLVRTAVELGLDPGIALQLATLNGAETYRLEDRGAIAPGRRADIVLVSDPATCQAIHVLSGGQCVVRDGELTSAWPDAPGDGIGWPTGSVRVTADELDLAVPAQGDQIRIIGVVVDQVVTEHRRGAAPVQDGRVVADAERDLAHLVVVERHRGTAGMGHGFVQGLGLRRGAIASTVAHDHHNVVAAGMDETSLRTAIGALAEAGGGLSAACGGEVLAIMPLPIAGLMSDRPLESVRTDLDHLEAAARELGSTLTDPFMTLSFLALEVIPSLKLTDQGLVDVERFERVGLFVS